MNNKKGRTATFDIETDGLLDTVTRVWCCVIKDHDTGDVHSWDINSSTHLLDLLSQYDTLIGHNCIAFDFPVLRKIYGWDYAGIKIDTLIMSRTQRPNRRTPKGTDAWPHSVEAWAVRLRGKRKVENDVWDHYHQGILERCITDVEIQAEIYQALLEEGKGEGWELAHRLNMKLFDLLQRQEEYGFAVDENLIDHHLRTLRNWIDRIDDSLGSGGHLPLIVEQGNEVAKPFKKDGTYSQVVLRYFLSLDTDIPVYGPFSRVSFRQVDLDSSKETKDFLLALGWKPKEYNTNDAGEKTSAKFSKDDEFEGISGGLGKLIAKRIQCKQRIGILEGWKLLVRSDGRVSTRVAGIASTGRLRHQAIVNIPSPHSKAFFARQMRQVFTTRPGWVLCGVDSKGNQVRQLAARMGDEEFTEAVLYGTAEDGTDLHSLNQKRSGAPSRSKAKNFFYGFIFGAGANKIASTIGISVKAAKELIEKYLTELPLLRKLIDTLTNEWRKTAQCYFDKQWNNWRWSNGYIKGLDGRPIYIDSEHKILCYALQSDEAIQMGAAYVKFHADMAKAGFVVGKDWGMCIWMHDEFQFECRPEIAEQAAKFGCEAITWAGRFYKIKCPHEGDYKIGANWYETH